MSSVDDRIVNMKFNNAQFGKGVNESKRDLTGLEKTITTAGRAKGMTTLGTGVQAVAAKFSALQVIGVTALATLTTKATSAGLRLLKSFTIQPIIDGFKEYTLGLESVQTIMSNTGKSVNVVNKYLDNLNHYADKTIYNFAQMAKNIGTFTAAGVRLPEATSSIKGIANLAAVSGSTSQQASTAMYQLSQAIAAGRVNLQDWNSVVNAGMGGKIFQTALARTAQGFGNISKEAITTNKETGQLLINGESFRNTISASGGGEPWLTGQILVETLKQISGDFKVAELRAKGFTEAQITDIKKLARTAFDAATQVKTFPQLLGVVRESLGSTVAQGFRTILGDFNQSKKLWSDANYALLGPQGYITNIQNNFTKLLSSWNKGEGQYGRFKLIEGFKNILKSIISVMGAVAGAWRDVFPKATGKNLFEITRSFKRFTENLRPSEKTLKSLRSIFGGVFAILHIGTSIISGVAGAFVELFGAMFNSSEGARGGILKIVASVAEVIKSFDEWLTSGDRLKNGIKTIGVVIGAVFYPIIWVIGRVIEAIGALASGKGIGAIAEPIDRISNGFLKFIELLLAGLASVTAPFEGISSMFTGLQDKISGMSGNFAAVLEPLTNLNFSIGGNGGGVFDSIIQGAKDLGNMIKDAFSDIDGTIEKLSSKSDAVGDRISGAVSQIGDAADVVKGKTSGVYDEITGAGADAASASMGKVSGAASGVGDAFDGVVGIVKTIGGKLADALGFMADKLSNIPFPGDALEWATLLNALISGALIKRLFFSKGLFTTLKDTIKEVGGSITETFGTMQNSLKANLLKSIGIAIALIVASVVALSLIPADKLGQGLGGLAAIFGLLALMMKMLLKEFEADELKPKEMLQRFTALATGMTAVATAMVALGIAIALLTASVVALAFIPWKNLLIGIGAVAALMILLVGAIKILAKVAKKELFSAAAAMVLIAFAINLLVPAILALAFIPMKNLAIGLGAIAAGLILMVGALVILSKFAPTVFQSAAALVLVATAINMLVFAVLALAFIPMKNLAIGLGAVAAGLILMVGALFLLSLMGTQALAAGAALLLISTSLLAMATVVGILGAMSWEVLTRGLAGLAAGLIILVGAAYLAMPVLPGLIALAIVIKALGVAALMTGAGFLLFATGLSILVALGAAGIAIMTLAIGAFIALLPNIAIQVAAAFVTFVQVIALAAPKLRKAFGTIFESFIGTIRDAIPHITGLIKDLLKAFGAVIIANISVVEKIFRRLLDAAIGVVRDYFPKLVTLGMDMIMNLLDGLENGLPKIVTKATNVAIAFINSLGDNAVKFANAGADVLIKIINGLSDAIETKGPLIRTAMGDLAAAIGRELRAALGDVLGAINPLNYLPSVDVKGWASKIGLGRVAAGGSNPFDMFGRDGKGKGGKPEDVENPLDRFSKAIQQQAKLVVDELKRNAAALGILKTAVDLNSKQLQQRATYMATVAESRQTTADIATESADSFTTKSDERLQKAKDMKKSNPKRKKEIAKAKAQVAKAEKARKDARKQQAAAAAAQAKADLAQLKADYEAQKEADAVQFKDDPGGLGDSKTQISNDLSKQAAEMSAQAQARTDEAARLDEMAKKDKKNAKKYHDQARELRKQAAAETAQSLLLAAQSIEAQAAAAAAYAEARRKAALDAIASLAEIRKQRDAEMEARKWQEEYDSLKDTSTDPNERTKATMLQERIDKNKELARVAEDALNAQLAIGDNLAAYIAAGGAVSEEQLAAANVAAEEAAKQADIAARARDAAEADAATLKQLNEQSASTNTTTGGSTDGGVTPSRSVLEDAANAVDRYTASVQQAEEAATAGASTTQFVQNNYSPEALSAATLYRQTNNLISAAEVQMDTKKTGGPLGPIVQTVN